MTKWKKRIALIKQSLDIGKTYLKAMKTKKGGYCIGEIIKQFVHLKSLFL